MEKKKFLHCLRIQIVPEHYEDERIANIVDCSKKYGFGNVMLFINAEEYNLGHMTKGEAAKYVATMKKAKSALEAEGISVSLNPWMELGHLDRGHTLKEGQRFTTMIDHNGKEATLVACPLCENWWEYFSDFYTYLLTELEPDTVWVEDDFRMHNHGSLSFGGCFCPLHMRLYSERMGEELDREEFVSRLFSGDERAKRALLDVHRETMRSLAARIGELVRSVSPKTKVGLMSSSPENHAAEGRDWRGIHEGLSAGGEMINRIHLPYTYDVSAKGYFRRFNALSTVVRALIPHECTVYPEIENAVFSSYSKNAEMLRFQVESASALGISGMTYDIYDFVGNGIVESFGYGEVLRDITPYLDTLTGLELLPQRLCGIVIPIDERASYNLKNIRGFGDLKPDEYGFGAYLHSLGFTCRYSVEKRFEGCLVALSGGAVNNFTDAQLKDLFAANKIILEGGAAAALCERGLGRLIGAASAEITRTETDGYSYEEAADSLTVGGIRGRRASAMEAAGDYVKMTYSTPHRVLTKIFTFGGEYFGDGIVEGENFYLIPFRMGMSTLWEQYNELRTLLLEDYVRRGARNCVLTGIPGVYAYLYGEGDERVLFLVNPTEESFEDVRVETIGFRIESAMAVDRESGELSSVDILREGNATRFRLPFPTLTTAAFVIKVK